MKRYLKSDISNEIINLNPKSSIIHPITLENIPNNTSEPFCLTKLYLDNNNNLKKYNKYKCISNEDNYKKYLFIPPVIYNSEDLLKIYNINSIDSLKTFISENINELKISTINRILNCWIKNNFDTLIKHNNILVDIYIELIENHYLNLVNDFSLKNETGKYINEWFKKHDRNEFNLNLLKNYIDYIKK